MYTIRFENGSGYSDKPIIFDDVCRWCQLKEIPRGSDGRILVRFILIQDSKSQTAHYEECEEVCR